jgi:3-hydroxybutyryl-CoA dehydrogenase
MGAGIAQVVAQAGIPVVVREVDGLQCARARASVLSSLDRGVAKGKLTEEVRGHAVANLAFTTELTDLATADLIIEAIVEDLDAKRTLWSTLDQFAPARTIFASNTSSLSIASQAAATARSDRFCGLHFFSPVPAMRLVEVVRSAGTSDTTIGTTSDFVRRLGKEPIITRDRPGFLVNLLLVPFMLDAIRALEQGVGGVAEIDQAMRLGAGHPAGPLALCDSVGLDTLERVADIMYDSYREQRYAAPALLRQVVASGRLGRKSGVGFYDYSSAPPVAVPIMG